jgi:transcription elongation factor GreA
MTQGKYNELKEKLDFWKKTKRPKESTEVKRLAEMGDFSENAGYQLAKGRLRGLNRRIDELQSLLNKAEIIENNNNDVVNIGNTVTIIDENNKKKTYKILGSTESDPFKNIISHSSPLGSALLNKKNNEQVEVIINGKRKQFVIVNIE